MPATQIQNAIEALNELGDAIQQDSCIKREPFIKLEDLGHASVLNYNLPQATCYDVRGRVELEIQNDKFKASENTAPETNFWRTYETRDVEYIRNDLDYRVTMLPHQRMVADAERIDARSMRRMFADKDESVHVDSMLRSYSPRVDKDFLSVRIKQGYMPIPYRRFSGELGIRYVSKPITPTPKITIVLHYKVCSYLGEYGAGTTIKTMSLLPGEKMEISVRHYLRNESTKKQSQHILDSFSTSSADDLQQTIENENTFNRGNTSGGSSSDSDSSNLNANIGLDLTSVGVPVNFGVSGGISNTSTNTSTFSDSVTNQIRNLDKSISSHVAKADTHRQIDVNTESTNINISEEDETIKRFIENYNKSRVLNFVFRQLQQEYFSITYLNDVTFSYSNGYPEKNRNSNLAGLEDMLKAVLIDQTTVDAIKNRIYTYLCNIPDYQGIMNSFIEKVDHTLRNCIDPTQPPLVQSYVRKRLVPNAGTTPQTYSPLSMEYKGRKVDGIIMSVVHRIVRTGSVIADSLLGQGEALDCYNQKLQDSAAQASYLNNLELVQKLALIEEITDPIARADAYKKVWGSCCSTPQTQIIP
jgi:hypothetical protein